MESQEIKTENTDKKQNKDKHWLFKPGQSGNPAGKPVGSVSIITEMKRKLSSLGPDQKRTYLETFVENLFQDALDTDGPSRKLVMQYIEGLPQQKLELTHLLPKPLDNVQKDLSLPQDKGNEEENKSIAGWDSSE